MTETADTPGDFASRILNECSDAASGMDCNACWPERDYEGAAALITARDELIRAEAREAALREAVEAIGDLDGPTETTDANIGIELGLTRAAVAIQKLIASPKDPSNG